MDGSVAFGRGIKSCVQIKKPKLKRCGVSTCWVCNSSTPHFHDLTKSSSLGFVQVASVCSNIKTLHCQASSKLATNLMAKWASISVRNVSRIYLCLTENEKYVHLSGCTSNSGKWAPKESYILINLDLLLAVQNLNRKFKCLAVQSNQT